MEGAMSFTVEVPGGTNPLSLQGLCKALESATTSLVYAQRQAAEQQLQTWETYPGYWSSLQVRNRSNSFAYFPWGKVVVGYAL